MTPEERSLLESTHQLAKENNEILLGMRRRARYGAVFRASYWILIIGLSFGAFYFLQPYVDFIRGFGQEKSTSPAASSYAEQLQNLLK